MSETNATLAITPDTRLSEILDRYPCTEPVLSEAIPSLAALRGSPLRQTVTQTLTLEQGAAAAGTNLPHLILRLREVAGIADLPAASGAPANAPDWVKQGTVAKTLDARPLLAQGQHPKELVLRELSALAKDQVFVLITPFVPGPLIELGRMQGLETWTRQGERGKFETWFGQST